MERYFIIVLTFALVIFLSFSADAFGVATLYSENYPLRMKPGEVKETFFLLRNVLEGDSDILVKSELTLGDEVASLLEGIKTYDLPYGEEVEVPIRIEVPNDAKPGTRFKIGATFRPVPKENAGGNIEFIVNIGKSFPVLIIDEETEKAKGKGTSLTLESEQDELVEKSAPSTGKNTFFVVVISGFMFGIILMALVIVLLVRRNRSLEYNYSNAGQYNNYGQNNQGFSGNGNY
ncbi:MAG: hypothetical protein Q7S27_02365 [Nanoarchaeota archaeon]|nr:hypothetical protein [Nanoarchaeota archaeon]